MTQTPLEGSSQPCGTGPPQCEKAPHMTSFRRDRRWPSSHPIRPVTPEVAGSSPVPPVSELPTRSAFYSGRRLCGTRKARTDAHAPWRRPTLGCLFEKVDLTLECWWWRGAGSSNGNFEAVDYPSAPSRPRPSSAYSISKSLTERPRRWASAASRSASSVGRTTVRRTQSSLSQTSSGVSDKLSPLGRNPPCRLLERDVAAQDAVAQEA